MDPRIATVVEALREAGATAPMLDTDSLAKVILDAIDREHGAGEDEVTYQATDDGGKTWYDTDAAGVAKQTNE